MYDVANFGTALGTAVQVATTNTGAFLPPVVNLGTINPPQNIPGNTTWVKYSGQLNYPGVTGNSNIGFEAVGGTTSGNLLDEIQLDLAPLVEFTRATSSTSESSTSNLPTFRVNGTVSAAFVVTVNITGGTATLGTDYTTPGNSTTITITVPAGNYDGVSASSLFALPITITNDGASESSETILLQLQPSASQTYQIMSSAVCGGAGQTTWDYTIIDDDQALTITKNEGVLVAVSGQPTQYDVPYQIDVTNPGLTSITYGLTDLPGLDSDVSILSASLLKMDPQVLPYRAQDLGSCRRRVERWQQAQPTLIHSLSESISIAEAVRKQPMIVVPVLRLRDLVYTIMQQPSCKVLMVIQIPTITIMPV